MAPYEVFGRLGLLTNYQIIGGDPERIVGNGQENGSYCFGLGFRASGVRCKG